MSLDLYVAHVLTILLMNDRLYLMRLILILVSHVLTYYTCLLVCVIFNNNIYIYIYTNAC